MNKLYQIMAALLFALALFVAGGCSTMPAPGEHAWSYNPANNQGLTNVHYEKKGNDVNISWVDGKDKSNIALTIDLATGKLTYSATGVNGSQAASLRDDVEKVFANSAQITATSPALWQGIGGLVMDALGIPNTGGAAAAPGSILKSAVPEASPSQ